jgi:hypothetical protein
LLKKTLTLISPLFYMNTLITPTRKRGTALWLLLVAFLLKCMAAQAQVITLYNDDITLTQQPTANPSTSGVHYAGLANDPPYITYTKLGDNSSATPSLGTYDLNGTSALTLTGASMDFMIGRNTTVSSSGVRMLYRVYLATTTVTATSPAFNPIVLPASAGYAVSNATVDLLAGIVSGGTYTLEVRYEIVATSTATGVSKTTNDPGTLPAYTASFYVTPPPTTAPGGTTVWQSTNPGPNGNRWFVAANWSNGIPNGAADVVIPENTPGSNIVFPVLDSRTVNYAVRNLTLQGTTNSGRAQLTIQGAVLHVYGNISQLSGGLQGAITDRPGVADSTANSTLILAGGNQFITGQLSVPDIIIAGTGVKSVANIMFPTNTISLRPKSVIDGVVLQTASDPNGTQTYQFDTTGNSLINLAGTGIINTNAGSNETITSYIKGVVRATGPLAVGVTNRFGNIGLELTPNHPATLVSVQRIIGDPLIGPTAANNPRAVPIKRQYFVVGDDNSSSSSTAGSTNTVVFRYLPSAFELNGIAENNLILFSSKGSSTASFTPLIGTLNTADRTVTKTDVASDPGFYFTLGDQTNPLPVTLVSFSTTRNGDNAKLVWATASEKNNRGFEVQVSGDGKAFRTLGFVASQGSNSNTKLDYTYTDTEAGKTGVRYYRLHQLDLDGTDSYSPVRVVSFDGGAALATELSIYPNPVTGDETRLLIQTAEVGNARLRITDLMGRTITDQTIATANGSSETKLAALASAKAGTYLAQLTLPSGQTKTIKVQKQ